MKKPRVISVQKSQACLRKKKPINPSSTFFKKNSCETLENAIPTQDIFFDGNSYGRVHVFME